MHLFFTFLFFFSLERASCCFFCHLFHKNNCLNERYNQCYFFRKPITSVTVLVGSLSLSKGTQRVGILRYEHPKTFDVKTKQDDIMLIKVRRD